MQNGKTDRMIKEVERNIIKHNMILPGDEIIAGVSGGADSVCMFMQLLEYKKQVDFNLKVVHINHMIREDASSDALYVKELCESNNIPCFTFEEDVENQAKELGMSTEEAGRRIRYMRFSEVMSSPKGKIAVAHNRGDVAETVLFNIFRGTGVEGLSSLKPVNGNIIRPLLVLEREKIEEYLREAGIEYRTDSTNSTTAYARNKIRNVILPYAEKEIVKDATGHVAALSDKMLLVREYIEEETDKAYEKVVSESEDSIEIDLNKYETLNELIKQEVILKALDYLTIGRKDIGQIHVEVIMSLIYLEGEKKADLPYNLEAVKQYDQLIIRKKTDNIENFKFEKQIPVCNSTDDGTIELLNGGVLKYRVFDRDTTCMIEQNTYTKWFDYDKISGCLMLRNRQTGDYLTVNDRMQKKSLKDYMIDCKIPKEIRDVQLLVADESHVLWVIGHRISEFYKITENTKKILEISVENFE